MTLKPHLRLIVMGTPGFILPTLYRMLEEKAENGQPQFDLVAVYTRAPKPAGHGMNLRYSHVHQAALELQKTYRLPFEIVTPETFKNPDAIKKFQSFKPDLVVVGAYGLILPKAILDTPPMGCLNLHASLLPYWRGASPIQRAILEGETKTGLTIMKLDEGCDTGLILKQKAMPIGPTMTAAELCEALSNMGPDLLMQTLHENPKGIKQDSKRATYAAKISKHEAQIDWAKNPHIIARQIRAFSPVPGAFTFMQDNTGRFLRLKVYNVLLGNPVVTSRRDYGRVLEDSGRIVIGCRQGSLELTDLQLEGKKRTSGHELSNGKLLRKGTRLFSAESILKQTETNKKKRDNAFQSFITLLAVKFKPTRSRAVADAIPYPRTDRTSR